ncbi:MAG: hypothetical protein QOJ59_684 [Thermomicrobiales bacterium]|nr:hypothetical protein [Thermomicrobiales bacterium]
MDRTRTDRDERNAASLARMRSFVERLTDEDLGRPLANGWTAAADIAHLAFWDRRASVILDRWARDGVSPSGADYDAINDAMLPQWLLIPPRAAVADALAAGEEINGKIAALTDDLAATIKDGEVIRLDRSLHRADHLGELERSFS